MHFFTGMHYVSAKLFADLPCFSRTNIFIENTARPFLVCHKSLENVTESIAHVREFANTKHFSSELDCPMDFIFISNKQVGF